MMPDATGVDVLCRSCNSSKGTRAADGGGVPPTPRGSAPGGSAREAITLPALDGSLSDLEGGGDALTDCDDLVAAPCGEFAADNDLLSDAVDVLGFGPVEVLDLDSHAGRVA